MYISNGKINENELAVFPATDGHSGSHMKPMCAWRDSSGVVRCGTWLGEWAKIERAWAYDTWGKWQGMPPTLVQANELKVQGIDPVIEGDDPVFHVASAAPFSLTWKKRLSSNWSVDDGSGVIDGSGGVVTIRSCSDGTVAFSVTSPTVPLSCQGLPDGSYIVFVQYLGIKEGLRLPPDYVRDPQYDYTTDDDRLSHYNPVLQVGEVPADPDNPLNILRRELITNNQNEDVFAYSAYLTSEAGTNGDGSAIKLVIGDGLWVTSPLIPPQGGTEGGVFATPARALCELLDAPDGDSPATLVPINFDPMAYVVSRALHTRKDGIWGGKVLLAGGRFSGLGTRPSLWQWNDDGTATLLATTEQACDPYCEQMLSTGLVTELVELQDGSIILLTLCSRHKYDPEGATILDRLPRWPAAANGEPGGQAMTAIGDGLGTRIIHTSEKGAPDTPPVIASGDAVSFYNQLIAVQGDNVQGAPGTLANLDGCLWRHRGRAYGVACNGNPTDPDAREFVTYYDYLWRDGAPAWNPNWLVLQRGASINGANIIFGWVPGSETAQVLRDDGARMKVLSSNFRIRAGTLTINASDPNKQSFIAPARRVIPADGNTPQRLSADWSLIETDGGTDSDDLPPIINDPLDPIIPGDGRKWRVIELPARGTIYCVQLRDVMENTPFYFANKDLNESRIGVRLRVDSDAELDDIPSYIWRVQMDQTIPFFIPAYKKVEMLIVTEAALAPELLPIIVKEV